MSTPKVILVTGASSGFGAMTVRALADAEHVVYAGMRDIGGRNAQAADAARLYANQHGVTLRPIEMDVSDQASVDAAVGAAQALRQLRDGGTAEEEDGDDHDRPDCVESKHVSQHWVLLHLSPKAVNWVPG